LQLDRSPWGGDLEKPQPELKKQTLRKNKRMEVKKQEKKISELRK
jgi:hypothetical protein